MRTRFAALASFALLFVAGHPSNADTLSNNYVNHIYMHMRHAGDFCGGPGGLGCEMELRYAGLEIESAIQRNLYLIQNENTRIDSLESSTQVTENTDRSWSLVAL